MFGEDAVRVVDVLKGVDEITDNEIADQTEIRLNLVRKTLYRLYDHSLVGIRLVHLPLETPTRPVRRIHQKPKATHPRKTGKPA